MSVIQPRTFGSTFYAALAGRFIPAQSYTDEQRVSLVARVNEWHDRFATHSVTDWYDALDAHWSEGWQSCLFLDVPTQRLDIPNHDTVKLVLDAMTGGCGSGEGIGSSWYTPEGHTYSLDAMFRQESNGLSTVAWDDWKEAVAAARSTITEFDAFAANPIDRFTARLYEINPRLGSMPKQTIALLLEEWVRVHNSQPIARIGDRLRITRPVHAFVAGQTVECVNVGGSVIFVSPVVNDAIPRIPEHYSLDRDMPAWEHLNGEPVAFIPDEPEVVEPEPDYKALYEAARIEHEEDIALIERKFWTEAIERSWCGEAESVMRWLNDNGLHMEFDVDRDKYRPVNRYLIKGYADVTITDTRGETWKCENHDFEISITGTSETDALDSAGEEIDNDDVRTAVEALTTVSYRTVTVNSWEFHRAEMTEAGIEND